MTSRNKFFQRVATELARETGSLVEDKLKEVQRYAHESPWTAEDWDEYEKLYGEPLHKKGMVFRHPGIPTAISFSHLAISNKELGDIHGMSVNETIDRFKALISDIRAENSKVRSFWLAREDKDVDTVRIWIECLVDQAEVIDYFLSLTKERIINRLNNILF